MYSNRWCPHCANNVRYTIKECCDIAKLKHGLCLSNEYTNRSKNLEWCCKEGHEWKMPLKVVLCGGWCPFCGGTRFDLSYCEKIAGLKGGKCLSKSYKNKRTKLSWECIVGHRWHSTLNTVKSGRWCRECSRIKKLKSIEHCKQLAIKNNGLCVSEIYVRSDKNLIWKCKHGHHWESTLDTITAGSWCPHCKLKSQTKLQEIIESIIIDKAVANFRGFNWLINKHKMEIDIWFPNLKIAIEYDGQQHFYPVFGDKVFEETVYRDNLKNNLIKTHSDEIKYFIRFAYFEPLNREYVLEKIKTYIDMGALNGHTF